MYGTLYYKQNEILSRNLADRSLKRTKPDTQQANNNDVLFVCRTVEVANSRLLEMSSSGTMPWTTSHLVASLIESMLDLNRLKMSAEFVSHRHMQNVEIMCSYTEKDRMVVLAEFVSLCHVQKYTEKDSRVVLTEVVRRMTFLLRN